MQQLLKLNLQKRNKLEGKKNHRNFTKTLLHRTYDLRLPLSHIMPTILFFNGRGTGKLRLIILLGMFCNTFAVIVMHLLI